MSIWLQALMNFVFLPPVVLSAEGFLNPLCNKSGSSMLQPGSSLCWEAGPYCSNPSEVQRHFKWVSVDSAAYCLCKESGKEMGSPPSGKTFPFLLVQQVTVLCWHPSFTIIRSGLKRLILLPLELLVAMCEINIHIRRLYLKIKWICFLSKALLFLSGGILISIGFIIEDERSNKSQWLRRVK